MRTKATMIIAVLVGTVAILALALANDTVIGGSGANIYPVVETTIALEREHVCFYQREHGVWDVLAVLTFFNDEQKEIRLRLGFPVHFPGERTQSPLPGEQTLEGHFHVFVEGRELKTTLQRRTQIHNNERPSGVFLFDVVFPPRTHTVIEHRYDISETGSAMDNRSGLDYLFETGGNWRGKIEEAVFEYRFRRRVFPSLELFYSNNVLIGRDTSQPIEGYGSPVESPPIKFTSRYEAGPRARLIVTIFDVKPRGYISLIGDSEAYQGIDSEQIPSWAEECEWLLQRFYSREDHPIDERLLNCHNAAWLRNYLYASYGYRFQDERWQREFYNSGIFLPSQVPFEDSWFTPGERAAIEALKKLEAQETTPRPAGNQGQ